MQLTFVMVCTAGNINSNPGNDPSQALYFSAPVPSGCLCDGQLLDGKLQVKMAVCAIGGLLKTNAPRNVCHSAQEVDVRGRFAACLVDGRLVQLAPLVPKEPTDPKHGCKLHPPENVPARV
jgi:hypothetical protein